MGKNSFFDARFFGCLLDDLPSPDPFERKELVLRAELSSVGESRESFSQALRARDKPRLSALADNVQNRLPVKLDYLGRSERKRFGDSETRLKQRQDEKIVPLPFRDFLACSASSRTSSGKR